MELVDRLVHRLSEFGSGAVAFSGGVDSSLVAALAVRAWGDRALAVTAASPALARGELDDARSVARAIGIRHEVICTEELERPEYRRNDRFRCYHCKTELYERLAVVAREGGYAVLLAGANADDQGDWRPGLRAAHQHGVLNPLLEAGVTKDAVRSLARQLGIPSADKPATPCLASRLPYGIPVTRAALAQVDRAEHALRRLGYRILRVRHYGERAKVEIGRDELEQALHPRSARVIEQAVLSAGYKQVELSRKPFQSGSLNAAS